MVIVYILVVMYSVFLFLPISKKRWKKLLTKKYAFRELVAKLLKFWNSIDKGKCKTFTNWKSKKVYGETDDLKNI